MEPIKGPMGAWIEGLDFSGLGEGAPDNADDGDFEPGLNTVSTDPSDPASRARADAHLKRTMGRPRHIVFDVRNAQPGEVSAQGLEPARVLSSLAGWDHWDDEDYARGGAYLSHMLLDQNGHDGARAVWHLEELRDAAEATEAQMRALGDFERAGRESEKITRVARATQISRTLWRLETTRVGWAAVAAWLRANRVPDMPCGCDMNETLAMIDSCQAPDAPIRPEGTIRLYLDCSYTAVVLMTAAMSNNAEDGFTMLALGSGLGLPTKETVAQWLR